MLFTKIPAIMGWAFTITYVALCALAVYFFVFVLPSAINNTDWVETTATVIDNKLVRTQHTHSRTHRQVTVYSAKLTYEYIIDGKTHQSTTKKQAERADEGDALHQSFLKRYPVGSELIVYYNPNKLDESVVKKGVTGLHLLLGGLLMIAISWLNLVLLKALRN